MSVIRLGCVLLVLGALGCGSTSPRPDIEGIAYGFQGYDDLPVPPGFKFDDSDRSWAYRLYEDSPLNLRCCVLRYVGDRDAGQLANWYVNQMPKQGWKQSSYNKSADGRRATLIYTKGSDQAVIDIGRKHGLRRPEPYTVVVLKLGATPAFD